MTKGDRIKNLLLSGDFNGIWSCSYRMWCTMAHLPIAGHAIVSYHDSILFVSKKNFDFRILYTVDKISICF